MAGVPPTGVGVAYLSRPRVEFPHVDSQETLAAQVNPPAPKHESITAFREVVAEDEATLQQLNNKVKVCGKCGKACAYTLQDCNSCGASLAGIALSFTDNVFMGFIYGVARGKFPYTISMRKQTQDFIAFDDPLSLSVCHLNAIPTSVYLADLRYLFADPVRGHALVQQCFTTAAEAAIEQFWGNDAFRRTFFADRPVPASPEDLKTIALCGMNMPPSMYQLHLQFVHPPLTPFHYSLATNENHFHHGRFYPLEFLLAALSALSKGEPARMEVDEHTAMEDILAHVEKLGVSYDAIWVEFMRRVRRVQELFQPWREQDFELLVVNHTAFELDGFKPRPELNTSDLQKSDKEVFQNYGRPYDASGRPSGTYYRYAKDPGTVPDFASRPE